MKVVLDTNVLVSALIKGGKPRDLFNKLVKELILSKALIEEFLETIEDPKIARYTSEQDVAVFLNTLGKAAEVMNIKSRFRFVKEDPDDDIVVWTAYDRICDHRATRSQIPPHNTFFAKDSASKPLGRIVS